MKNIVCCHSWEKEFWVSKPFVTDLMFCFKTKNKPFSQLGHLVICNLCYKIRRNFAGTRWELKLVKVSRMQASYGSHKLCRVKWNYYLPSCPGNIEELWYCHFMSEYDMFPCGDSVTRLKAVCCFLWVTGCAWRENWLHELPFIFQDLSLLGSHRQDLWQW